MLTFQPKVGSVVYCDYRGFIQPEMIKKRPVIIVSSHKQNYKLVSVVPISTTPPYPVLHYHLEMNFKFCIAHLDSKKSWVKCDMINVVCLERLHLVKDKVSGKRYAPRIDISFLLLIKESIKKVHQL